MKLIDEIKLHVIFFLTEGRIFELYDNYEDYIKNIKSDPELNILFKSGCSQITNNKGFNLENPINDISVAGIYALLRMLNFRFKRLKSDYKGLSKKYIIDKFEISNAKESLILYHKVYTSDIDMEALNTQIKCIDNMTNKFKFQELSIVASRPSMGVTSLLVQFGMEFSNFHNVYFLSNKKNVDAISQKVDAYSKYFTNNVVKSTISIKDIEGSVKIAHSELSKIYNAVVIIDDFETFGKSISVKFLKNLALTNKLFIMIGLTLGKSVEKRLRSIPTLDDLPLSMYKQSFADRTLLLRRPFYYNLKADSRKITLFIYKSMTRQKLSCKLIGESLKKIE